MSTERLLCIGGVMDGERVDLPAGADRIELDRPPWLRTDERSTTYRVVDLLGHRVLQAAGHDLHMTLGLLVRHYSSLLSARSDAD